MASEKYKAEYCKMLVAHMKDGFSLRSFAGKIGVNPDTIYEWAKRYPEFADSKKKAIVACEYWWEDLGRKHALTNPTAWIFNMKARFGWRDQPVGQNDSKEEVVISDIEADAT